MNREHSTVRRSPIFSVSGERVICGICSKRCSLNEGEFGFCGGRFSKGRTLYTRNYGNLSVIENRPIEIKPFFHFWPGSRALTISSWGCNMRCPWCQNHHLSMTHPGRGELIPPDRIISLALQGSQGLCISFNEPLTLFEYALDLFEMKGRLYATFVSNGQMTPEALEMLISAGLDAIKVDIKGGPEAYRACIGDEDAAWETARIASERGVHVEIVNLLVTGYIDFERVIDRHLDVLGETVPLHFTRYYPAYRYHKKPTPVKVIEEAVETARSRGLRYVYAGNLPDHLFEDTLCPSCGNVVIERGDSVKVHLTDGRCPACRTRIHGVGMNWMCR